MGLIKTYRGKKFSVGYNHFVGAEEETGMKFQILTLKENSMQKIKTEDYETALLVIEGKGSITIDNEMTTFDRKDWTNQNPTVVHLPAGDTVMVKTEETSRFGLVSTRNSNRFTAKVYAPDDIDVEHRGKDILDGTCYRLVRLAFDRTNSPSRARLVVGEVLNFPGKWSSYPPHHHEQPEIYYYEFSPSEGYGHGELGDEVFKINHHDLLMITNSRDHSQVSAPGYYMYYIWAVRHIDDNPYTGFEFTKPYDRLLE